MTMNNELVDKIVEIGLKMMNGLKQVIAELKADALSKAQACRALAQQNEKLKERIEKDNKIFDLLPKDIEKLKADALSKAQACRALAQQNEKLRTELEKAKESFTPALITQYKKGRKEALEEVEEYFGWWRPNAAKNLPKLMKIVDFEWEDFKKLKKKAGEQK